MELGLFFIKILLRGLIFGFIILPHIRVFKILFKLNKFLKNFPQVTWRCLIHVKLYTKKKQTLANRAEHPREIFPPAHQKVIAHISHAIWRI